MTRHEVGKPSNLADACVIEALAIIADEGVEALSLREVARRLKVSHQAPYKHFASRDHILAEAVKRAFESFSKHLASRPHKGTPLENLASLGASYIAYARRHPAHYRLMFGTPLPDPAAHPEMMEQAQVPFQMLREIIARIKPKAGAQEIERDALFAWSTVHGLASILETRAGERLDLHGSDLSGVVSHTLKRIGLAIATSP